MNFKKVVLVFIILFSISLYGCDYNDYDIIQTDESQAIEVFENYVVNTEIYDTMNGYSLLFINSYEYYEEVCKSLFNSYYDDNTITYFFENCYEITYRFRVNSSEYPNIDYIIMSSYVMENNLQNISITEVPEDDGFNF